MYVYVDLERYTYTIIVEGKSSTNRVCLSRLPPCTDSPFNLDDAEWADINIVTGCLKLYFRELPDPLIPASQFQKFIDAASTYTPWDNAAVFQFHGGVL